MKKSLIALACGMLLVVVGVLMPLILFLTVVNRADASAGIIGGADGPTAIFLTPQLFSSSLFAVLIWIGSALIISALFCLVFRKTVKEHCGKKTSLLSLILSADIAFGAYCFMIWLAIVIFNSVKVFPIARALSIIFGVLSFVAAVLLLILYIRERKKRPSAKGVVIDILLLILCLVPIFKVYEFLHKLIF